MKFCFNARCVRALERSVPRSVRHPSVTISCSLLSCSTEEKTQHKTTQKQKLRVRRFCQSFDVWGRRGTCIFPVASFTVVLKALRRGGGKTGEGKFWGGEKANKQGNKSKWRKVKQGRNNLGRTFLGIVLVPTYCT